MYIIIIVVKAHIYIYIYKLIKIKEKQQVGLKVPKFSADAFLRIFILCICAPPHLRSFPNFAFEAVPVFQCSASSFHASLLQVISGVMSQAVCLQLVSQAVLLGGVAQAQVSLCLFTIKFKALVSY